MSKIYITIPLDEKDFGKEIEFRMTNLQDKLTNASSDLKTAKDLARHSQPKTIITIITILDRFRKDLFEIDDLSDEYISLLNQFNDYLSHPEHFQKTKEVVSDAPTPPQEDHDHKDEG